MKNKLRFTLVKTNKKLCQRCCFTFNLIMRETVLPVEGYAVLDSLAEKALQDGEQGVEQPES